MVGLVRAAGFRGGDRSSPVMIAAVTECGLLAVPGRATLGVASSERRRPVLVSDVIQGRVRVLAWLYRLTSKQRLLSGHVRALSAFRCRG